MTNQRSKQVGTHWVCEIVRRRVDETVAKSIDRRVNRAVRTSIWNQLDAASAWNMLLRFDALEIK
ncbi:hypothetical protein LCGC14_0850580 [marine sediment metagenome]|uniref:Uncharacterized protein n=1 Tax=marine sediment metagenome TaxID=412755 RepID=A0A0F9PAI3_9ZZZZ